MSDKGIEAARRDADAARERLLVRAHALQTRLKPAAIVEHVRQEVRRNAETGAERVVEAARRRPVAVGLAAAGAAALLALPPLVRLARRGGGKRARSGKDGRPRDKG